MSKENEKVLSERDFENVSIVSSAYSISSDSDDHFGGSKHYTLSVTDKKIPKTPDTPKTGDNICNVLSILILSGFMLSIIFYKNRKKRNMKKQ